MSQRPNPFTQPIPPQPQRKQGKAGTRPQTNGHAAPFQGSYVSRWQALLKVTDKGKVMAILTNVMIALREAPEWQGVLALDAFANRMMVQQPIPGAPVVAGQAVPRELTNADIANATAWLQQHDILVASGVTLEAIETVGAEHGYHPVREYLAGLKWDGVPRIDYWLAEHMGAEDTELNRAFASKWLIGLVARVMRPGCQLDTALILESLQGRGKSSAFRALGGDWYTDQIGELGSKDSYQQIHGVWIIEMADLASMRRTEVNRIKAFLSGPVDRFRPAYGRLVVKYPRQCGFGGSVNPGGNGYLRDETGARRFWCVACAVDWEPGERVDIKALELVRDQLWAEALVRFKAGEAWYLETTELEEAQEEAAEERRESDAREPLIAEFIRFKPSITMAEILGDCLEIPKERWERSLQTQIGIIMKSLKWQRKRVRLGGKLDWRYEPPR